MYLIVSSNQNDKNTSEELLQNIFNKDKKTEEKQSSETFPETQNSEPLTEIQILDILTTAISDVGYWSWWTTDLPTVIQIEFGGTLLYFPPDDNSKPPNSQIAIQFKNPKSISFLTRQETHQNWFDDLHNDKLEPPTLSWDYFTFTDNKLQTEIINEAKSIETIHGYSPKDEIFLTENYKLAFWAGDYGFAVSSDEIKIVSQTGQIELDQIPKLHSDWWAYWKRYYKVINTKNALPKDYACEVTIPMKNE